MFPNQILLRTTDHQLGRGQWGGDQEGSGREPEHPAAQLGGRVSATGRPPSQPPGALGSLHWLQSLEEILRRHRARAGCVSTPPGQSPPALPALLSPYRVQQREEPQV